jgi:hypothetical protein
MTTTKHIFTYYLIISEFNLIAGSCLLFSIQNNHSANNLRQDKNAFFGTQMVASFMVSIKLDFLINPLRLLMEAGGGLIRCTFLYISKFYFARLPVKANLRSEFQ